MLLSCYEQKFRDFSMKSCAIIVAVVLMGSCLFSANTTKDGDKGSGAKEAEQGSILSPLVLKKLARVASFRSSSTDLDFDKCNMRATEADISQIMELYAQFDQDDCKRLLLFPIEVREEFLARAVRMGRIFVTKNHKGRILAFCKAFIVDDEAELQGIVVRELRALNDSNQMNRPEMNFTFSDDGTLALNFDRDPHFVTSMSLLQVDPSCAYIYFGGAFTLKEYRDLGINFELECFAIKQLSAAVCAKVAASAKKMIYYLYGAVEDNFHNRETGHMRLARFRTFTGFTRQISLALGGCVATNPSAVLEYSFHAFRAFKPVFFMNAGALAVLPDTDPATIAGIGYGCVIGCAMR